ncbi:MAG TPA: GIY-YIG nuclease family protein, partial [Candidatus Angelobacter sp.]
VISTEHEGATRLRVSGEIPWSVLCHVDTRCSPRAACATLLHVRDGLHYKFWVYILASRSGTLYVGITGFFDQRIHQHKYDSIEGFTKKYQCHRLVYYESYQDVDAAIGREKQIKRWRRQKKIALIEKMNPRWQDLAENWGREMRFRGQSLGKIP